MGCSLVSNRALPVVPAKGREAWVRAGKENRYLGVTSVRSSNTNEVERYVIDEYCTYEELPRSPNLDMMP